VKEDLTDLEILQARDRPWWPIVASFGFSFLTAVLATVLCLVVQEKADRREREQREQLAVQAQDQHDAICAIIVSLDDNAAAVPPTTALGKAQARTYITLRTSLGCPPRTEK
jgi:hypothetical protein